MRGDRLVRLSVLCGVLLCLSASSVYGAQARIAGPVSSGARITLPNSVHGKVRLAADLGPAPGTTKLEGMTLRFNLSDQQQVALSQLLEEQQDPSSPHYHQWLTPAQYGAQFGLASSDLAKVTTWLTGQGFTVDEVPISGTYVRFSGTVAQANAAFGTSIHNVALNGNVHFANVTDVSLPAALSGVVEGVTGLHNFHLKPRVHTRKVRPSFTSSISGNHYLAPGDFYTIYNELPALQNGISGSGVTIAVMGQVDINTTDVAAFRTASGLAASTPTIKVYGTDPGAGASCSSSTNPNCPTPNQDDVQESSLDVEWAGAAAPGASILFVTSSSVIDTSMTDLVNDQTLAPTVGVISVSYGDCESSWGTSELTTLNQLFKQANAEGITMVGPAGDDGATDCDSNVTSAVNGLAVDFPASSPYVTAMGGTMFNEGSGTGATSYWAGTDTTVSAAPSVTSATVSALSYLPETAWNENVAGTTFSAGGGGVSNFFNKPPWQVGIGVPGDASRDVPDVALNAAASHDGYLYCSAGSCVNGTFRASDGQTLTVGGGTSFATPTFAGILALIEQKTGSRIGNANPIIYGLGNNVSFYNSTSSSVFHDITSGDNDSPCTAGSTNCPNGGSIGFNAGVGYDLVSGWGSVNVQSLLNAWNLVTPIGVSATGGSAVSSTTISAAPATVAAGSAVTLTAAVTGSSGTPTGTVQFLLNNAVLGAPVALTAGTASYSYTTSCAAIGQLVVSASYSGDSTYAGSKGAGITTAGTTNATPVTIDVTSGGCPDFTVSSSSSSAIVTSGNPSATISVKSINNFAGTVTFSASSTGGTATPTFAFSPASVILSAGGNATTTLTLPNITAQTQLPEAPFGRTPWYLEGSGVALAGLTCLFVPRRRRLSAVLVLVFAFGLLSGATGCGAKNNTTVNSNTIQSGTYTVTVVASANVSGSTTSHISTITFTVQ